MAEPVKHSWFPERPRLATSSNRGECLPSRHGKDANYWGTPGVPILDHPKGTYDLLTFNIGSGLVARNSTVLLDRIARFRSILRGPYPIAAKVSGSMTIYYGHLCSAIAPESWTCLRTIGTSGEFCRLLNKYSSQFVGESQGATLSAIEHR